MKFLFNITTKTLGFHWPLSDDTFGYKVRSDNQETNSIILDLLPIRSSSSLHDSTGVWAEKRDWNERVSGFVKPE